MLEECLRKGEIEAWLVNASVAIGDHGDLAGLLAYEDLCDLEAFLGQRCRRLGSCMLKLTEAATRSR